MNRKNSFFSFLMVVIAVVLLSNLSVLAAKKHKPKKPVVALVVGTILEVDASGTVVGVATNNNNPNEPPFLLYTLTNLGNVYASGYADLPCPNNPNVNCYGRNNGFRTQIPASSCDGNQHVISVYVDESVIGFRSPIAQKSFVCYRADSPDKIPDRTPVIFIPGIGGSVLAERNADGTETVIYPDKLFSFEGLNDPTAGLNRLDLGLNPTPDIVATDALRRIQAPIVPISISNVYGQFIDELKFQGEHTEYDVAGIPERRSSDCQAEQLKKPKADLFCFWI